MAFYGDVVEVRRILDVAQTKINTCAAYLDDLRTQCAVTAELTQQEIRKMEGKIIKLYSDQLVIKAKLADSLPPEMRQYPSLRQWLEIVGLTEESIKIVCSKVNTLEALKEKSDHELSGMLNNKCIYYKEEHRRLCRALHNLRRYMDILIKGDMETSIEDLYWDSWDSYHLRKEITNLIQSRVARCSIPSENSIPYHNNNNLNNDALATPLILTKLPHHNTPLLPKQECVKFPSTPPPGRKHLISVQDSTLQPEMFLLSKSKSHESQLASRPGNVQLDTDDISSSSRNDLPLEKESDSSVRRNLPTKPIPNCTIDSGKGENFLPNSNNIIKLLIKSPTKLPTKSPIKSPIKPPIKSLPPPPICTINAESDDNNLKETVTSLQVPKSPCTTPTITNAISHTIAHRFTKSFNVMTICDVCEKPMFMNILKCKECKYRCHRECEPKAPPSCGLPQELFDEVSQAIQASKLGINVSPILSRPGVTSPNNHNVNLISLGSKDRRQSYTQSSMNIPFHGESSSNIFRYNRSTPSSPALLSATVSHSTHAFARHFQFPDVPSKKRTVPEKLNESIYRSETSIATISNDKNERDDKNDNQDEIASISRSDSSDSEDIPRRISSQESLIYDSEGFTKTYYWPRQNSLLMQDWDISYEELQIGERIGKGRFGTVYRGFWHGDVAIKVLNMRYYANDEKTLKTFRLEVTTLQKTKHDNIILFMGACAKPPRLALVIHLSKGMSLFARLHLRNDRFSFSVIISIAQQICQAMSYLHAREIIHTDLRTKNIFYEKGKVMVSDFGLFNITKLCYGNRKGDALNVPSNWLCYLAPEIIRRLKPLNRHQDKLPFSKYSDIYAFGTIWYELLCGEWPFRGQPSEAIIWQVGKGMKQSLANLQASRDIKDILMLCWSYRARQRPDYTEILNLFKKLPRKKLARSSSNPVNFSRSAESMF